MEVARKRYGSNCRVFMSALALNPRWRATLRFRPSPIR